MFAFENKRCPIVGENRPIAGEKRPIVGEHIFETLSG